MWTSIAKLCPRQKKKNALRGIEQEPLLVRACIRQEMQVVEPGGIVIARCLPQETTRRNQKPLPSVKRPPATRTEPGRCPQSPLGIVVHQAAPEHPDYDEAEAPDLDEPVGNGAREAGSSSRSGRVLRPADVTAQRSQGNT